MKVKEIIQKFLNQYSDLFPKNIEIDNSTFQKMKFEEMDDENFNDKFLWGCNLIINKEELFPFIRIS